MSHLEHHPPSSRLLQICGVLGLVGCVAVLLANLIGTIVVEQHNPISETISSLAITEYGWIMDLGLDIFAVGTIAVGFGLHQWHLGGIKWKAASVMLLLLGIDVFLIAEHNQYAGREGVGAAIHIYCVYAFYLLFGAAALLLSFRLKKISQNWFRFSLGTFVVWMILAPIFFPFPTRWDGAYERFLGLIVVAWIGAISWLLIQRGAGKLATSR
ncbi:MAG: DUF998 domain-containing protein [Microcoleaceae cyanobacterium]